MSWYLKIIVPLVSILLTLLVAELLVRMVIPQNTSFYDYGQFAQRSTLVGQETELLPNASNPGYTGVSVETNSVALRDREIVLPKPAGTYRVLTIGDSVTFGYGVELDEIYLKVLESELNAESGGTRFEVINGGLIAGSLSYHYHFLRRSAEELDPDMIVIGLVLNDIKPYAEFTLDLVQPVFEEEEPGLARRINTAMRENSHLYQMVYANLKGILFGLGVLDVNNMLGYNFVALGDATEELEFTWERTFWVLENIFSLAREKGFAVALVVFPLEIQLNEAALNEYREKLGLRLGDNALNGDPQRRLREFAAAQDVPYVDLLPAFRKQQADKLYLRNKAISHDPVHPSPFGHRVAGQAIYRELRPYMQLSTVDPAHQVSN
jgi:lysophospholipase L1-like esterase